MAREDHNPNWHYLVGLDKDTGEVLWKSTAKLLVTILPQSWEKQQNKKYGVMYVFRVGSAHQVPEPYGYSLVDIARFYHMGLELPAKDFFYNSTWNEDQTEVDI